MMRSTILVLGMLLMSPSLRAQEAPAAPPATRPAADVIQASDKDALTAKLGQEVIVEGVIDSAKWSNSGKVLNVSFKDSTLLGAAFEKNKEKINAAFEGDAAAKWTGAKVHLSGKLTPYGGRNESWKDRPQIIIDKPEQVTIVEPAAK